MKTRAWMALATLGPVGRVRPAPGSWGSAAAVILAALLMLAPLAGLVLEIATLLACVLGIRAADIYERQTGSKDASDIVIDEVAGQWIALLAAPPDWRWWIAAFILFRLFDIVKPGPVRMAERLPGGYGVMADDIVAGALAAACLIFLQWVLP